MHSPFTLIRDALLTTAVLFAAAGCDSSDTDDRLNRIRIGNNIEITGTIPDVGEQSRRAVEMYVDEMNDAGGIEIGGERFQLDVVIADNRATADGAIAAANSLISTDNVLVMVGPNPSNAAIPAGGVANDHKTVMISPWSTNPATTQNRPWVFRVPFLDTFQGPVLANFATDHYGATSACVLFDEQSDYPRGLAESFRQAWESLHGASSITAYESFATGDEDFSDQLERIREAGCDVFFVPQYTHEVPLIVTQAHAAGIDTPILGSDSWGGEDLLDACGADCEGYFFSAHYIAAGATGVTKTFIDRYQAAFGSTPGDVAALSWDAMLLIEQGLKNCGTITGNLADDRACLRSGVSSIEDLNGVTGDISFDETGDPIKCLVMVKIENGAFTAFESACP